MFAHIGVGLDGSIHSAAALDLALQLGRRVGGVVHGVHVIDLAVVEGSFIADISGAMGVEPLVNLAPQVRAVLGDLADTIREHFEERAAEVDVSARFEQAEGSVPPTLVGRTAACGLVVVGKRGVNARYHGDLLGPVCERLLRLADIPVVVTPETVPEVRRLLLAYDGGGKSDHALRWCGELARALSTPVTALTAQDDETTAAPLLERTRVHLTALGVACDTRWASGEPAEVIAASARDTGADLVVLGSHSHSRIVEMVMGSTTEAVVRRLDLPVMCVP